MLDQILQCPKCSSNFTHNSKVNIIFRQKEDGDGVDTTVTRSSFTSCPIISDKIEGRRDNIYIHFDCESCQHNIILHIQQHKGQTRLIVQ